MADDEPDHDRSIEYLGVTDEASHYLFVLDASASMDTPCAGREGTKKSVSRRALIDAIHALDPAQSFSVVFFTDESYAMSSRFVRATPDNQGVATAWIENFKRQGTTNIWSGFERAFEIAATVPEKERADPKFKISIFVLSDGRVKEPERVIEAVKSYVKGKKIVVNALSFDPTDTVLERVAAAGGGSFARP
ncbi:MAG: VWA domain-containing protein [Planctomycetes bacterium]|nr:VWA domain-containing protein [Planctomycetota bacterium]